MNLPVSTDYDHDFNAELEKRTDFFIAGNSKSGTSALYFFLSQHPELCMSSPKEPNFFATDFCHDEDVGAFTRKSLPEYLGFFNDPAGNHLWGEASACYLYSTEAAKNIYSFNPDARIIVIFREPVSFLHSYHLQQLKNPISEGETEKDFERALQLEEQRKKGEAIPTGCLIPELLYYSDRVRYAEHLSRFYEYFSQDQVLVLIYEDFKRDNEAIYDRILDFLNVDRSFRPPFKSHNKGQKLRSKTAQKAVHRLSHGIGAWRGLHRFIKSALPSSARQFLLQATLQNVVYQPKDDVDPRLRRRLKIQFQSEVRKFSDLIGRDMVKEWGYTEL